MKETLLKVLAAIAVVSIVWGLGFLSGSNHGKSVVQSLWDKEKIQTSAKIADLKEQLALKEETHRAETRKVEAALQKARNEHTSSLAAIQREYNARLQQSEARSTVYQRQAEGGSDSCRDLASHTAELDRSLEEGRNVVRELGETLRLRDSQLQAVGNQLINDRNLFTDKQDDRQDDSCTECSSPGKADGLGEGAEPAGSEVRSGTGSTVTASTDFADYQVERPAECSWCSEAEGSKGSFDRPTEADPPTSRMALLSTDRTLPWFGQVVQGQPSHMG